MEPKLNGSNNKVAARESPIQPPFPFEMKKALVLDDSRAMRQVLRSHLLNLRFEVWEADNGVQALELLRDRGQPDICLVDWVMPIMNGMEFLQAVRANGDYAGLRVLMVTSETDAARLQGALDAGADESLSKPFTHQQIQGKLAALGLAA